MIIEHVILLGPSAWFTHYHGLFLMDCAPPNKDLPLALFLLLLLVLVMNEVSEGCHPIIAGTQKGAKCIREI